MDIAKLAGVAPMTVSRVINGSGYVSAKLREKVQSVIDKLEYHPNALARGLKSQRSHVIGILRPIFKIRFPPNWPAASRRCCSRAATRRFISTTEQSSKRELAALGAFFDHRVAGIVVATMETEAGNEALERFTRRGMPIVLVGRSSGPDNIDRVTADHWKGAYDAVEHLISLGHTRIGYIGGSPQTAGRLRRFHGYRRSHARARPRSLTRNGSPAPKPKSAPAIPNRPMDMPPWSACSRCRTALPPIFARNDFTAMGAMSAARDRGVSIPQRYRHRGLR